ncbi:MAG: hypothetical protein Q8O40_15545 [Chloroflexota bacterium]|nr:hypothetical protein [Chloroflexota bacterium]
MHHSDDHHEPYFGWEVDPPISILHLVESGTLDLRLSSLLWLALERRLPVVSAAKPRLVGKTTLLVALRDLAPPWLDIVYTRGEEEDLCFLQETDPARTSIWVNELSDHLPWYFWGQPARELFAALERGYGLAATLHADTPEQLFTYLAAAPLRIPPEQLARLGLIIVLGFFSEAGGWVRRVRAASLVLPNNRDGLPATLRLAEWEPSEGRLRHNGSREAVEALARRLGLDSGVLAPGSDRGLAHELARRQELLARCLSHGETGVEQVRAAVSEFYSRTGK